MNTEGPGPVTPPVFVGPQYGQIRKEYTHLLRAIQQHRKNMEGGDTGEKPVCSVVLSPVFSSALDHKRPRQQPISVTARNAKVFCR
jgi:hypothetical protein